MPPYHQTEVSSLKGDTDHSECVGQFVIAYAKSKEPLAELLQLLPLR
jgi:hypothetical protein